MAQKAGYKSIKKLNKPLDMTREGTLSVEVASSIDDENTGSVIPLSIGQMLASQISSIKSTIGPVEDGTDASQAYAVGEHFQRNGKYCTAVAAIAQGATLTLNTNYIEGSISDLLDSVSLRPLPLNADLNNYVDEGNYTSGSGTQSGGISNTPVTTQGFRLEVKKTTNASGGRITQIIYPNATASIFFIRTKTTDTGWNGWYKYTGSAAT